MDHVRRYHYEFDHVRSGCLGTATVWHHWMLLFCPQRAAREPGSANPGLDAKGIVQSNHVNKVFDSCTVQTMGSEWIWKAVALPTVISSIWTQMGHIYYGGNYARRRKGSHYEIYLWNGQMERHQGEGKDQLITRGKSITPGQRKSVLNTRDRLNCRNRHQKITSQGEIRNGPPFLFHDVFHRAWSCYWCGVFETPKVIDIIPSLLKSGWTSGYRIGTYSAVLCGIYPLSKLAVVRSFKEEVQNGYHRHCIVPAGKAKEMGKHFRELTPLPAYMTQKGPMWSWNRWGIKSLTLFEFDQSKIAEANEYVGRRYAKYFNVPGFTFTYRFWLETMEALNMIG